MNEKGFFGSLFDLSFSEYVTKRIVKAVFVLGIVGSGLAAAMVALGGFSQRSLGGLVVALVGGPLVFLIYVVAIRVWLEIAVALFRIAENTSHLVDLAKRKVIEEE